LLSNFISLHNVVNNSLDQVAWSVSLRIPGFQWLRWVLSSAWCSTRWASTGWSVTLVFGYFIHLSTLPRMDGNRDWN